MVNEIAIVLGASKGIGRQTFVSLREQDIFSIGIARSVDKLESLVNEHGGVAFGADTTKDEDVDALIDFSVQAITDEHAQNVHVIYAPGLHERAVIDRPEIGKDYSVASDFVSDDPKSHFFHGIQQRNFNVNVLGAQKVYEAFSEAAMNNQFNLDFVYISSEAAARDKTWAEMGNPFYAPQKQIAENYFKEMSERDSHVDIRTIRFGMAGETMAKDLIEQLQGLEAWFHIDEDINNPTKPWYEVSLAEEILAKDIANFMMKKDHRFTGSRDGFSIAFDYTVPIKQTWQEVKQLDDMDKKYDFLHKIAA